MKRWPNYYLPNPSNSTCNWKNATPSVKHLWKEKASPTPHQKTHRTCTLHTYLVNCSIFSKSLSQTLVLCLKHKVALINVVDIQRALPYHPMGEWSIPVLNLRVQINWKVSAVWGGGCCLSVQSQPQLGSANLWAWIRRISWVAIVHVGMVFVNVDLGSNLLMNRMNSRLPVGRLQQVRPSLWCCRIHTLQVCILGNFL